MRSSIVLIAVVLPLVTPTVGDAQDKRTQEDKDDAIEELMSGSITLRFYNAIDGKEIPDAKVEINGIGSYSTDDEGKVRFASPQEDGKYPFRLEAPGFITSNLEFEILAGALFARRFSISPQKTGGFMKHLLLISPMVLAMVIVVAGCGGSARTAAPPAPQAPEWVTRPPKAVDAIYGVGAANVGPNVVLARQKAEDAARQEIAKVIDARVKNMMDRFMQEHQDLVNPASTTSVEFTRTVSRSVSQASLAGVQIEEVWQDVPNKVIYAKAVVTKTDVVQQVKSNVAAQKQAAFLEQRTDEALKTLDKALENWDTSK